MSEQSEITKQWDTEQERLETELKPLLIAQQTSLKVLRQRVGKLHFLIADIDIPCEKDISALFNALEQCQKQWRILRRSYTNYQLVSRKKTVESRTVAKGTRSRLD